MSIRRSGAAVAAAATVLILLAAGCGSSGAGPASGPSGQSGTAGQGTVSIDLTAQGCQPRPASAGAGQVQFNVANKSAGSVTEAELRSFDEAHILGERENLTPGLSGSFTLDVKPGKYKISCPGAAQPSWTFTVTGEAAAGPPADPRLTTAARGYAGYVDDSTAALVSRTQALCRAIGSGSLARAQREYPQARVYYEQIEPVAEVWGDLDTRIDGRWENPVTVASKFTGFHKIEQLLWADRTLAGGAAQCAGLVRDERRLHDLVQGVRYTPQEMASGATDLINEAATSKITGEEERYSHTDLVAFRANVAGALEVVSLLKPYLQARDPDLVAMIQRRDASVSGLLARYQASPGYDRTGYVSYADVSSGQRRQLSAGVNALAEALSKISGQL
ncbi:MAG TPA: iron uptake system protein EfeO [Streptosporangiaceae bacterium]